MNKSKEYQGITHDRFRVFTIFKCDSNVGVTIIVYLFTLLIYVVYATMASDVYVHILNHTKTVLFCEHCKKYQNFIQSPGAERKASINGLFAELKFFNRIYSNDSLNILVYSRVTKNDRIFKFPPPHVLTGPRYLLAVIRVVEYVVWRYLIFL